MGSLPGRATLRNTREGDKGHWGGGVGLGRGRGVPNDNQSRGAYDRYPTWGSLGFEWQIANLLVFHHRFESYLLVHLNILMKLW